MDENADTLINGVTYQRITTHMDPNTQFYPWFWTYYVRTGQDGKGYAYLLDSLTEYLTMDPSASIGDTVFDVLCWDESNSCGGNLLEVLDVVVLDIDTLTDQGLTVVRHYVLPFQCGSIEGPYFWQAGLGTSQGVLLGITSGLSEVELKYASINDTCYFNAYTNPYGLPGGPSCCTWVSGVEEQTRSLGILRAMPNPNNGLCTIDLPQSLRATDDLVLSVYDNTGQLVQRAPLEFTSTGLRLDVRAHTKGIYHVELGAGEQRYTGTIVFE